MGRNKHPHRSCVEDRRAVLPTHVFAIYRDCTDRGFPEAEPVDVGHSHERRGVVFCGVHGTERQLTIILTVFQTRDLVRGDRVLN